MKTRARAWPPLLLCFAATVMPGRSSALGDAASRARALIVRMDLEAAGRVLSTADPDDVHIALERARLALYEMDCDAATVILARTDVQKLDDGSALADIAHGCARATAALKVNRDEGLSIEIEWQDEHDAALAPLLSGTVERARDMLSRDLGVDWPRPTRIVVVRDALSLSAMTGLPYSSAKTTGTVAVAKWGRVTILSPRATPHGYMWLDTIVHELTHLAVTRASGDRAPLWLQEGVAKYEESRWRPPKPFDDWPPADALAKHGIDAGHGYALDKLGPSIAMLPSAEAATIAFAEVTSFVRFYLTVGGEGALPKLLHAIDGAPDVNAALVAASGADLKSWDARWRAYLATRPADKRMFLLGLAGESRTDKKHVSAERDQRDRSRLAELLLSREHSNSALKELGRLDGPASAGSSEIRERRSGDPYLRWLRGLALEGTGDATGDRERLLFGDPQQVLAPFGPWWASRGRWLQRNDDAEGARSSFIEALHNDPLDPECACEVRPAAASSPQPTPANPLCSAAQSWAPSPFDD